MHYFMMIPFIVQTFAIGFDEYYFHIKRGLPLWERIGHPIDTLSVLCCFLFALLVPYSPLALKWYIALTVFSCLMVTKDEWVHKHHCPGSEHWLHALLFINHPIILTAVGLLWANPSWMHRWLTQPETMHTFLVLQAAFTALFFCYQVIYWNFIWKEKEVKTQ